MTPCNQQIQVKVLASLMLDLVEKKKIGVKVIVDLPKVTLEKNSIPTVNHESSIPTVYHETLR